MSASDFMTSRTHVSSAAYDPFEDTRGPVGYAAHFDVERIPGSMAGEPARFRKTIKRGVGADLLPMIHRENLLLMDMATRGLRHVAQSLEFTRDSSDTPFVVTTLDAGPSLNLWRGYDFVTEGSMPGEESPVVRPFLTPAVLARLLHHLLLALREFHGAGFIHCDIHAGNVCLPFERRDGQILAVRPRFELLRLIDFGHTLSARLNFDEPLRLDPEAAESLRRVSPAFRAALHRDAESGRADTVRMLDFRLDLYALGALASQLLGSVDWSGEPHAASLHVAMSASVEALLAQDCDATTPEPGLHDRLLRPIDAMLASLAAPNAGWLLPRKRAVATSAELARETPLVSARATPIAPPVSPSLSIAPAVAPPIAVAATQAASPASAAVVSRVTGRRGALIAALCAATLAVGAWQLGYLQNIASTLVRSASTTAPASTAKTVDLATVSPASRVPSSAPALTAREVDDQLNTMIEGAASGNWRQVDAAVQRIGESAVSPGSSSALLASGRDAIEQGDYERAATTLRRATAQAPTDWKAWSALGYATLRRNELDAAKSALNRSLHLHPQDASAWAHLGEILALQDNAGASAATLQLAVYFSTQRARTLAHLRAPAHSLIAPEFQAVIQDMGGALEQVPQAKP
ncbi:serine/threonine protein kinase [Variovorax boronicumulans]|uniref:tetratricopeptide repeat protein n=1 Tax=Variovorax boronicumulans TaxID=436515 RepID=UPI00278151DD|nr:tetratricopeptide repeat protein [Variovorax boronicumulans]MDP9912398.1 serine/threonine protein kinase [Variovorax boronicumulans]